jgi:2-keto-4-pentenoate hydratase/2-oxohepta-3-ene-1,7-dioic acid hydratase in catechol pathway
MKLIAYQKGERRIMAKVLGDKALPVADLDEFWASPQQSLMAAAQARSGGVPIANLVQVPPLPDTARVLCAGLNYVSHAQEAHFKVPEQPDIFARWRSTLAVDGQSVPIPPRDDYLDWEGELAVVVGKELRDVTPEAAQAGFLGYACFNDLSARKFQMASERWTLGKNTDSSGPLGPWIITADEIPDPGRLRIQTRVNGNTVQDGNTANLIFSGAKIAAYASGAMTLKPGDLIATGTPEGIGATRKPPMFLHPGDTVEVEIERIGRITNRIVQR